MDEVVCSYYQSFLFIISLIVLLKRDIRGLCCSQFTCFSTISGEDYVAKGEEEGERKLGRKQAGIWNFGETSRRNESQQ